MIYRDHPDYKPLKERAQALTLQVAQITHTLDEINRAYHCDGESTPMATRTSLQADRSAARLQLIDIEIKILNIKEELRTSGQRDLLDELVVLLKDDGKGLYLPMALARVEAKKVQRVEEGTPA